MPIDLTVNERRCREERNVIWESEGRGERGVDEDSPPTAAKIFDRLSKRAIAAIPAPPIDLIG